MCGGGNNSGATAKCCGACELCCPTMRKVCVSPSCCFCSSPSPCCPCPASDTTRLRQSSSCCGPQRCCDNCCPPTSFSCSTTGPCPTACCGAKCNQIVTCCPEPTIQPIQIWGCTPHGCCGKSSAGNTIVKYGGGGYC